ncbi:hypothetical protein H4R19_004265, partial [Coemansia spiralis]
MDADTHKAGLLVTAREGKDDMVWYLGYGSNMNSAVLTKRRGVHPVEARAVVVPGYQLTFDMAGLPYWEPGFGTIEPLGKDGHNQAGIQAGAALHCVAFRITRKELEHIVNTEGGSGNPDFGYQLIEVACTSYDGAAMAGQTLVDTQRIVSGMRPSQRYREILIKGATEHGLSPEYIERLAEVKAYVAQARGQKAAKYIIAVLFAPLMLPAIVAAASALALGTQTPRAVAVYNEWIVRLVWLVHDYVFAP